MINFFAGFIIRSKADAEMSRARSEADIFGALIIAAR